MIHEYEGLIIKLNINTNSFPCHSAFVFVPHVPHSSFSESNSYKATIRTGTMADLERHASPNEDRWIDLTIDLFFARPAEKKKT